MMRVLSRLLVTMICVFSMFSLSAQDIVLFENPPPFTGDCTSFILGQTVNLERGAFCGNEIGIAFPDGVNIIVSADTTIVLDQIGDYVISCNTPGGAPAQRSFEIAACLRVSDNVVPTIGEWGIINLSILMLIVSVIGFREFEIKLSHKA